MDSAIRTITGFLILGIVAAPSLAGAADLHVTSDFSGGSGKVLAIDQDARRIELQPSAHPGRGWECWWHVRITGLAPGETVAVEVGPAPWATPNQAAISHDGAIWTQSPIGRRGGKRITYAIRARSNTLQVAWGPPFSVERAKSFVDWTAQQDNTVKPFELCRTREGRPVWALHFAASASTKPKDRLGVWIQARQHAWEAGSSWVCQGVVEWLIDGSPESKWLRKRADIYVVPIMDVDSVAIGAGGKNQRPQDHNRDWTDRPHWPSVRAAQQRIKALDKAGAFDLFIDLHNPGASARNPFFFVPPEDTLSLLSQRHQQQFLQCVRFSMIEPLPFKGVTQPSGAAYDAKWQSISKNWVAANTSKGVVSVTLETAWNTPHSTQTGYRTVGSQLAAGATDYLRLKTNAGPISVGVDP